MLECEICGKQIEKTCYDNRILCSSDECWNKAYWQEMIENKDTKRQVRIKGIVYYIGDENTTSSFRGFDGAKYVINFFDGRKVFTSNLWHNSTVPDEFKDQLPDNAEFGDIQEYFKDKDAYETY